MGRTVGVLLMVLGAVIGVGVTAMFIVGAASSGPDHLEAAAAIMGTVVFGVLPLVLVGGGGLILYRRAVAREQRDRRERDAKRLLGMIRALGKVGIADAARELELAEVQVKDILYDLVHRGEFTGYIDSKQGCIYSKEVAELRTRVCPSCGGEREVVGKGVVTCTFCGAEMFV